MSRSTTGRKAVLISVHPKFCELIAAGLKSFEIRLSHPDAPRPFKCYIYCTLSGSNEFFKETCGGDIAAWNRSRMSYKKGRVIGEFVCDRMESLHYGSSYTETNACPILSKHSCLTAKETYEYGKGRTLWGWHITEFKMYDEPLCIEDFEVRKESKIWSWTEKLTRAPQSWCYVEELAA